MASPTPNLALTYPAHGGAVNAWDAPLNADFDALDATIGGTQTFAGGTAVFGAAVVLSQTQANNRRVIISGVLTANFAMTFPAIGGLWVIDNQTTGAFNITAITAGSAVTPVNCYQGVKTLIGSNGTDMSLGDDAGLHVIPFNGNPNGSVAGTAASAQNPPSVVWDYTGQTLYVCTTTGNAAGAVWSTPNQPVARGFDSAVNLGLTITHTAGNLLQVALKTAAGADPTAASPVSINFQSLTGTATNGLPTTLNITSALSVSTVAGGTGCSLGATNNVPFRFWVAVFNDGGTPRLALRNCSAAGGPSSGALGTVYSIAEYGIASTTAMTNASNAPGTWYTSAGVTVTDKAFRLLGYCEYANNILAAVQTGSYSADPTNVVLFGPGIKKPGDSVQVIYSGKLGTGTGTQSITLSNLANLVKIELTGWVDGAPIISVTLKIGATTLDARTLSSGGNIGGTFAFNYIDGPSAAGTLSRTYQVASTAGTIEQALFTLTEIMA